MYDVSEPFCLLCNKAAIFLKLLQKSKFVKNHQCVIPSSLAVFLSAKFFGCSTHNNLIQNPENGGYPSYSEVPNKHWGEGGEITGDWRLWLESITRSLSN